MKAKYLIIGGGITGLSFAENLGKDEYFILEKEEQIGGYCRTIPDKEFVWDYAGHFFHFHNDKIREKFASLLDSSEIVHNKKNTKVYYKGRYIEYPFQFNIHQLPKEEFIDCLVDLFECHDNEIPKNFEDMLYKKYGKSISEKFLKPYNEKLYACDLNILDVDAMGRFFPKSEPEEIICGFRKKQKASYNDDFLYPLKGAEAFVDVIYRKLNQDKILVNTEMLKIDLNSKKVYTTRGIFEYEYLINTIPLNEFLEKSEVEHSIDFSCNQVLVFNMGFDSSSNDKDHHWIYYPDKEICFYRVGFYNNILHEEKMSIYVELGFKEGEKIDVDMWREKVIIDLKRVGVIAEQKLVSLSHVIMKPAYVHITKDSQEKIKEILNYLSKKSVFTIGRYGVWTYCSIEDCIIQADELYNSIRQIKPVEN